MQAQRTPTLIYRRFGEDELVIRFWNIGGYQRFTTLRQRFLGEFFLARPIKVQEHDWIVLLQSQQEAIQDFCRRYGLRMVKEHELC